MVCEHLLEPDHDPGVLASGDPVIPGPGGQTGDQCVNEALFYGSSDLGVGQNFGPGLGKAAGLRMQTPQPCRVARRGAQNPRLCRQRERFADKSASVCFEVPRSQS